MWSKHADGADDEVRPLAPWFDLSSQSTSSLVDVYSVLDRDDKGLPGLDLSMVHVQKKGVKS